MKKAPVFSVIVPVYNKEPHIKRSLMSVLAQTFQDFELIVVCDPSTDKSNAEVEKIVDARVRVFSREKPGPGGYAARNLGVKRARSNWVTFLDADDEWTPEHLENLSLLIRNFKESSVFSAGWRLNEKGVDSIDEFSLKNKCKSFFAMNLKEYLLYEAQRARPIWTSVVCIKRPLLEEAGLFPEDKISMGGDIDTWLRCVDLAQGCVWSNHVGAIYHRDAVNMVTKNSLITPDLHLSTTTKLLNKYGVNDVSKLLKIRCNNVVVTAWNHNMRIGCAKNFKLIGKLFFAVQPAKASIYFLFSMLPFCLQKRLHGLVDCCIKKLRKLAA